MVAQHCHGFGFGHFKQIVALGYFELLAVGKEGYVAVAESDF